MGNIQDGDVLLSDLTFVSLPGKMIEPYLLRRGDVLFSRTNSQEWVGKLGIFRHDEQVVFASYLIRLRPTGYRSRSMAQGPSIPPPILWQSLPQGGLVQTRLASSERKSSSIERIFQNIDIVDGAGESSATSTSTLY
jgi:hypothetical protein